jgi:hypothetical protein
VGYPPVWGPLHQVRGSGAGSQKSEVERGSHRVLGSGAGSQEPEAERGSHRVLRG